ncbi:hypothetical protein [Rhodococcus sp. IEGM 1374]|uniref:hypothetical protein n=1 Tax=Rhodococcus sp. IEGM 1374 TaxID=3082221 RepID=UPI002953FF7E|nr:hypothetical protein [Rhodococcus sp. IEGM 1374]MDV7992093.1 hypothetical protein [Rhodococcus sp. IEGM 1374]
MQKFPASAAGEFVAEKTGLSVSTVRNIRKAKTWDKFEERRVALKRKESADRAMKPAPRPIPPIIGVTTAKQKPQGVGRTEATPVDSPARKLQQTAGRIEERLDKYVKTNNKALEVLHEQAKTDRERVKTLEKVVSDLQKAAERNDSAKRQTATDWFSWVTRGKKS